MNTTPHQPRILGALPAPAWHRPWLRYVDAVDGAEGTPPAADPPAAEPAAPAAGDKPAEEKPPWGDDFDPERAWNRIQAQKADLAAERGKREKAVSDASTAAAQQAREDAYREFGKHLGIVKDDEAPTVEGLQVALQERDTKLSASDASNLSLRIENAVLRFAEKHGADADALTDSSSFTSKLKALDPAADDYATQVEALVKSTVESGTRYRKVQVAPQSSNGDPAPTGGAPSGEKSIDDIRKERQKRRGVTL